MIAVVVLALLMVPVFFVSVMRFFGRDREVDAERAAVAEPHGPPAPVQ
jgi:multidrug efflux pump